MACFFLVHSGFPRVIRDSLEVFEVVLASRAATAPGTGSNNCLAVGRVNHVTGSENAGTEVSSEEQP